MSSRPALALKSRDMLSDIGYIINLLINFYCLTYGRSANEITIDTPNMYSVHLSEEYKLLGDTDALPLLYSKTQNSCSGVIYSTPVPLESNNIIRTLHVWLHKHRGPTMKQSR